VTAFVIRRLLYVIPLLLGVATIVFVIFDSGILGDRVSAALGKHATAEQIAALRSDLGLDKPLLERYGEHLWKMATLDLGRSTTSKAEITEIVKRGAIPSLTLTLPAFLVATVLAVSLSVLCAAFRGGKLDRALLVTAVALMSVSSLVYILFAQYFLAYGAGAFPISGYVRGPSAVKYLVLPWIIFVFLTIGPDLRFYRTAMLEEVRQDYVRTARAKGLPERRVLFKHVLRNGLIPVITQVVVELPFLFLGSLLLESFFEIPGLGYLVVNAVFKSDVNVIRALIVVFAFIIVIANLVSDILYTIVDPRVKVA
jgi:peptide/nickel transport system permease protein